MTVSEYWPYLRRMLTCWLCLLGGLSMFTMWSLMHQSEMSHRLSLLAQKSQQSRQQAEHFASYQADIDFYRRHQLHWQQMGFFRSFNAEVVEKELISLQQRQSLAHVDYQILQTITCAAKACSNHWPDMQSPEVDFSVTPIRLSWKLTHESDILGWLQQLTARYAGMILLRRCQWTQLEQADHIAAECELELVQFPGVLPVRNEKS